MFKLRATESLVMPPSFPMAAMAVAQTPSFMEASRSLSEAVAHRRSADHDFDGRVDAAAQKLLGQPFSSPWVAIWDLTEQIAGDIELVDKRLARLGSVSSNDGLDLVVQRPSLVWQRAIDDAVVRHGSLAYNEADQLIAEIDRSTSEQFSQVVSFRIFLPVTPAIWHVMLRSVLRTLRRMQLLSEQGRLQLYEHGRHGLFRQSTLGLLLGAIALFFVRGAGQRWMIDGAPGHRLRRSADAVWWMVRGTAAPPVAAFLVVQGLGWIKLLPLRWSGILDYVMTAGRAGFSQAVIGSVLLKDQRSSRIVASSNETATALRPLSWRLQPR